MKPPSLLRSLVFWSGLMVMGFIVWAWWDSTRNVSYVQGSIWKIESWASGVTVFQTRLDPHKWKAGRNPATNELTIPVQWESGGAPIAFKSEAAGHILGRMRLARAGHFHNHAVDHKDLHAPLLRLYQAELDPALHEQLLWTGIIVNPSRTIFIPYWVVLGAAVVPWAGLIAWRVRRMKRHASMLTTMTDVA